jgi:hypothetical protein
MSENSHEVTAITANALIAKRADILLRISEAEKQIDRFRAELVHVDIVLRMFRPDVDMDSLPVRFRRPTKSPYFGHGELTQRIYNMLREQGSVSSTEVAIAAMIDKGLNPQNDVRTRIDFVKRIARVLHDLHRTAKVEKLGRGKSIRWRLASY